MEKGLYAIALAVVVAAGAVVWDNNQEQAAAMPLWTATSGSGAQ